MFYDNIFVDKFNPVQENQFTTIFDILFCQYEKCNNSKKGSCMKKMLVITVCIHCRYIIRIYNRLLEVKSLKESLIVL